MVLNIGNLELMFNSVYANMLTDDEKITYTACVSDLINLDAVVVVASGNVGVSPCLFLPVTVIDTAYD